MMVIKMMMVWVRERHLDIYVETTGQLGGIHFPLAFRGFLRS